MEDIKKVDSLQDSLVLAVSTPYETYMQLDDRSTDVRSILRKKGDCIMRTDLRLNLSLQHEPYLLTNMPPFFPL